MDWLGALWDVLKRNPEALPVAGGVLAIAATYVAKHISQMRLKKYEAQYTHATAQLRDLYGPLFMLATSNDKCWHEFRSRFRPGRPMNTPDDPMTAAERTEYLRWLEHAFVPCNDKMRSVIERNAHLFSMGKAPDVVLDLLAHFDELTVLRSKLADNPNGSVAPAVGYPKEFAALVRREYEAVVAKHARFAAKVR